jgi:Zn-dependent metalloprotease
MIIYLLPALAAMMLPSLLKDNAGVASLSGLPNVAFYLIALALIVISYLISYLISFKICENKEI